MTPSRLKEFGGLFWVNAVLLLPAAFFMAAGSWYSGIPGNSLFSYAFAGIALVIGIPLFGLNLTAIVFRFIKTPVTEIEKLAVPSIAGLIGAPLVLCAEYSVFGGVLPGLPILNTALIFPAAIAANPRFLSDLRLSRFLQTSSLAVVAYLAIVCAVVFAYFPLPDYDPYYWIPKLDLLFADGRLTPFGQSRPLFSALVYIFVETAGFGIYTVFKYLLPFLILLALPPLLLASAPVRDKRAESLILLLPFASGSFLLYTLAPIPQGIGNIFLIIFAALILHAWRSGKSLFFFLAGLLIFGAFFYHETTIAALLAWTIVAITAYRKTIWAHLRAHWLFIAAAVIFFFSLLGTLLSPLSNFITYWVHTLLAYLFPVRTNFLFPYFYVNIDGNETGWGSATGVAKYYLFYAGPAAAVSLAALLVAYRHIGRFPWFRQLSRKEPAVLAISFILFFVLSDILPRLFSFALLPERALGFAGFFLIALSLPLFSSLPGWKGRILRILFIGGIFLNVSAAIYINIQKKYLIPHSQIESAQWITAHLPQNRLFLTDGNINLLQVHAGSGYVNVEKADFYRNGTVFDTLVECLSGDHPDDKEWEIECTRFTRDSYPPIEAIRSRPLPPLYIYYARPDERNPYRSRPYFAPDIRPAESSFVFDRDTRFRRIYEEPGDEIVIWEYRK